MSFEKKELPLKGCFQLAGVKTQDARGWFFKLFHKESFQGLGLETDFVEEYITESKKDVIRGLHFQVPPHDHCKLVSCFEGRVQDVLLDLRKDSSTYGEHYEVELSGEKGELLFLPSGIAHGFCVLSETAKMYYATTSVHSASHDKGILWSSVGVKWASQSPILSERDQSFPGLDFFNSPF